MRDGHFCRYWVYIVGSRTGTLYTGMTGFLDMRIGEHKSGVIEGFSKKCGCQRLLETVNPRWEDLAEHWGQEVLPRGKSLKKTP